MPGTPPTTTPDLLPRIGDADSPDIPRDMNALADKTQEALNKFRTAVHQLIPVAPPFANPVPGAELMIHRNGGTAHMVGLIFASSGFSNLPVNFTTSIPFPPSYGIEYFTISINGGNTVGPRFRMAIDSTGTASAQPFSSDAANWDAGTWIAVNVMWVVG